MVKESRLSKEAFLWIASTSGLNTGDPHIEELFDYVQNVLLGLKAIEELDLTAIEPIIRFTPSEEQEL